MAWTRAKLRTRTLQRADADGSDRWDASAGGEVDDVISEVVDEIWRDVLNLNRWFKARQVTVTSNATTGRYLVSALSDTTTANDHKRLYRILSFERDNILYDWTERSHYPLAETYDMTGYVYWREGDNLFALPKELSKNATVWVNYLPTRVSDLTTDAISVPLPIDGYEMMVATLCAAELLRKGGAETQAARELELSQAEKYEKMLADIGRTTTDPRQMMYDDIAIEWGSV